MQVEKVYGGNKFPPPTLPTLVECGEGKASLVLKSHIVVRQVRKHSLCLGVPKIVPRKASRVPRGHFSGLVSINEVSGVFSKRTLLLHGIVIFICLHSLMEPSKTFAVYVHERIMTQQG